MAKKLILTVATTIGLALPIVGAWAKSAIAEDLIFVLTNSTAEELVEFYTSPTGFNRWEEDVLGGGTLAAGESVNVTVADGRESCSYDIRGVFEDGSSAEHYDVNLCELDGGNYEFVE